MKKNNFKYCMCICALLSLGFNPINTFATTPMKEGFGVENTKKPSIKYNPDPKLDNTTLDGQIGEWDPNRFEEITDIEGNIPQEGEYKTISVTVPFEMEFMVLHNSQSAIGSFYSPIYKIKNNGSKELNVKVKEFSMDETFDYGEDYAKLYVEKINRQDNKTQLELKISAIEDLVFDSVIKSIDLTELNSLTEDEKILYTLRQNETKRVKFSSNNWELPQYVEKKTKAKSDFDLIFEFSIK